MAKTRRRKQAEEPKAAGSLRPNRKSKLTDDAASAWADIDDKSKNYEGDGFSIREFYVKNSGETAMIQIVDGPFAIEGHTLKTGAMYDFLTCQKTVQKSCAMCQEGIKNNFKVGFKILDYRGNFDKDAQEYLWDEPIEKYVAVPAKVASQLRHFDEKFGLKNIVLDYTRQGKGTNTTYIVERAEDDEGNIEPMEWTSESEPLSDLFAALSDDQLLSKGVGSGGSGDEGESEAPAYQARGNSPSRSRGSRGGAADNTATAGRKSRGRRF